MTEYPALKLATVVENFSGGLLMETAERRVEFTNSAFCRIFSIPLNPEELVGVDCCQAAKQSKYLFKDPEVFTARIDEIAANGEPVYFELLEMIDGRFLERDYVPVFATGNLVSHLWVYRDVTRRVKAEKEIENAARQWRTTFDSISDMIAIVDNGWKITRANKAFAGAFGKKPVEIIGKHCYEIVHNMDQPPTDCPHPQAMQQCKPVTLEFFEPSLHMNIEATASPILSESGQTAGAVLVLRNVTERAAMQKQLVFKDRLATIGELVSGVAHELNNPLTGVIGFSDFLLERDLPEEARQEAKLVSREARRAAAIVKNLLTFAREQPGEKTAVSVNDVINRTLELRSYAHKTKRIEVRKHLAEDLPPVIGNNAHLHQVFSNIFLNAEQVMWENHRQGTLEVCTERDGNMARIRVSDDGPGVDDKTMEKLFNSFFTTREVGQGTSLELSICHGIISEHNGNIRAESEPSKGATFIIELPCETI